MDKITSLSWDYVSTGSFIAGPTQPKVLEAVLGTCVAVTLHDPKAAVGGMIHLLLAEPVGGQSSGEPEAYASTGLPIFIKKLLDLGAVQNGLEACLAGGALIGPVSGLDRDLDIGGRTSDTAAGILNKRKIPIRLAETGGYIGCRVTLNMGTWETRIEPLISPDEIEAGALARVSGQEIEETIQGIRPIPQIALKIIRMLNQQDYRWSAVADELAHDQVLVGKVLHLCNAAAMGLRTKVKTIERAVVLLGEKKLLQATLSAAFDDYFLPGGPGYSLVRGGLYRHAVGTALTAERLAELTGAGPPDLAYTAGLLHDIGKVVLDQHMAKVHPLFYHQMDSEGLELISLEQEIFGWSHIEVGRRLAESWALPDDLVEVIGLHHSPEKSRVNPRLTALIYLADLLMSRFHPRLTPELVNVDGLAALLRSLGLRPEQFAQAADLVPRTIL